MLLFALGNGSPQAIAKPIHTHAPTRLLAHPPASYPPPCSPTPHPPSSTHSLLLQLAALCLDSMGCGEGLPTLTQLTRLSLAPQQGARIVLQGLPLLRQLAIDLSAGSCGRDLVSAGRSSVHVPAQGHGLHSLAQLELRCFVWRQWEAHSGDTGDHGDDSSDGSSDAGGSEQQGDAGSEGSVSSESSAGGASSASSAEGSDAGAGSVGSWQEGGDGSAAASSEAGSDEDWADEAAGSEAEGEEMEVELLAAGGAEAAAEDEEEGGSDEEQHEQEEEAVGLLEASWGFLAGGQQGAGQQTGAMASLEQR